MIVKKRLNTEQKNDKKYLSYLSIRGIIIKKGDKMRKLKLYLDTSVWNFVYADDAPYESDITKDFFDLVQAGRYEIFISEVVIKEINDAPEPKKEILFKLIDKYSPVKLEATEETKEIEELTEAYLAHKIISPKKRDDALHVAIATVSEMDAVISWNYNHLANLRKAELFNAINLEEGYTKRLEIVTPLGVSKYED